VVGYTEISRNGVLGFQKTSGRQDRCWEQALSPPISECETIHDLARPFVIRTFPTCVIFALLPLPEVTQGDERY
jgi:hypothetical protein